MSRPKPGMGRGLRRTLGQAKVHSNATPGIVQLAPIVSQHATSSRTIAVTSSSSISQTAPRSAEISDPVTSASTLTPFHSSTIAQLSHLSLIPQWDPPTAYFDPFAPAATIRDDIVTPYRPGRRIPPIPLRAATMLAPRPIRITETLRHKSQPYRNYTSSTAPALDAAVDAQVPFPNLSIPPWILSDKLDPSFHPHSGNEQGNTNQSAWSFWTTSHASAGEPEVGLVPQQPPSPGPGHGGIKPRETAEHTVFSPSTAVQHSNNSSSSHALLNHYVASFPDLQDTHALPTPGSGETAIYSSSLEFRIGASGLAKVRPPPTPPRSTPSGRERPPPPRTFPILDIKAPSTLSSVQVGEDAYFARPDSMCIADGVGGWARSGREGSNAARWSRLLTHFIREEIDLWWKGDPIYVESNKGSGGKKSWSDAWREGKTREDDGLGLEEGMKRRKLDAVEIMQRGFEKCLSCVMSEGIRGSSTCILALLYHSTLCLANLGDCALLLIRNGQVIFRTSEMQHAFNHPLQVGTNSRDEPMKDAMAFRIPVEREDIVVLGSDGLIDNLYDEDILDVLATFASPTQQPTPPSSRPSTPSSSSLPMFDPQSVSEALCAKARSVSEQTGAVSPFMERAIEEGIDFVGGKKDDISVIVGVVGEREM